MWLSESETGGPEGPPASETNLELSAYQSPQLGHAPSPSVSHERAVVPPALAMRNTLLDSEVAVTV